MGFDGSAAADDAKTLGTKLMAIARESDPSQRQTDVELALSTQLASPQFAQLRNFLSTNYDLDPHFKSSKTQLMPSFTLCCSRVISSIGPNGGRAESFKQGLELLAVHVLDFSCIPVEWFH